jgi:hypothetical protein
MTCNHRSRPFSRGFGFWAPLFTSAALSGSLTYVILGAQPSNARATPPAARARDVSVAAELVKAERGWSIRLQTSNAAAEARRCNIVAALTRRQSNVMSRTPAFPRVVWSGKVALTVPAHGTSPAELAIPATIAKAIPDAAAGPSPEVAAGHAEPPAELAPVREHFGVQVEATCGDNPGDRVS